MVKTLWEPLSDWDDWGEDEADWWCKHPLQRPAKRRVNRTPVKARLRAGPSVT